MTSKKFRFGDKVTWQGYRAVFDFVNKHGDAVILMHHEDFVPRRKNCSFGHHDVAFKELRRGWHKDIGLMRAEEARVSQLLSKKVDWVNKK